MIYDISQPLFDCCVFPGDPRPERKQMLSIADGDVCNLTALSMCAHNGTHVDAPVHFLQGGSGIGQIALEKFIGKACVVHRSGDITADDARQILAQATAAGAGKKLLIGGPATVTQAAAEVFAAAGIDLIGNESQTVGPENAPKAVHLVLLKADVVLLEGIRLQQVPDGVYFLNCAPLNLGTADGAPCRATLTDLAALL